MGLGTCHWSWAQIAHWPDRPFLNFEASNDVPELQRIHRSPDREALKL